MKVSTLDKSLPHDPDDESDHPQNVMNGKSCKSVDRFVSNPANIQTNKPET